MVDCAASIEIPVKLGHQGPGNTRFDAKICRVNAGFFVLSSAVSFDGGQRLEVFLSERPIQSEVVYCKRQSDGTFRLGLSMCDEQHGTVRTEQRIPVNLPTRIRTAGGDDPSSATVIDISPSGLGLISTAAIPVGEMACVDLGAGLAFGEIRHCTQVAEGYRLGLRIEQCLLSGHAETTPKTTFFKAALALVVGGKHDGTGRLRAVPG